MALALCLRHPDIHLRAVTTVSAAALEADDSFSSGVARLAVMGGVFAPMHVGGRPIDADADFNLNVDRPASIRSLNAGLPTLYVPCDVTFGTALRTAHLDRLRQG